MDHKSFIIEQLQNEYALPTIQRLARWASAETERLAALMEIYLEGHPPFAQRAAWVLGHIGAQNHEVMSPWLDTLIDLLGRDDVHVALRRNAASLIERSNLSEDQMGRVVDLAFAKMIDRNEGIAVRACLMGAAYKICIRIPELMPEFRALLEDLQEDESAGIRNRAKRMLNGRFPVR